MSRKPPDRNPKSASEPANKRMAEQLLELEAEERDREMQEVMDRLAKTEGKRLKKLPPWVPIYLAHLELHKGIALACQFANISTSGQRMLRMRHESFAELEEEAVERYGDRLRSEALRRGRVGVLTPKFHNGKIIGYIRVFSDTLLMAEINATGRPEYRRYFQHKHSHGEAGGGVLVVPQQKTPEEWIEEGEERKERIAAKEEKAS